MVELDMYHTLVPNPPNKKRLKIQEVMLITARAVLYENVKWPISISTYMTYFTNPQSYFVGTSSTLTLGC